MTDIISLNKLITSEYGESVKFNQVLNTLLTLVQNVSNVNHQMSILMNIETATGKTLDLIGGILGQPRQVNFQPSTASSILNDDYYRMILKAKIVKNQWDGTKEQFYNLSRTLFPDNPIIIFDNQNMTANILIFGLEDTLSHELITHGYIIPKPAGVKYIYGFLDDTVYFGFDLNTDLIKGWDLGNWVNWEEEE